MTQQRSVSFILVLIIMLICSLGAVSVSAADLPSNPLTNYKHLTISTANSGSYYIKFDGGGLNALHMTTSIDEPYGQVTSSTATSGTFYISDTGGRGFFNNLILMVAVKPPSGENTTIPDDFSVTISSAGYTWEPTGVVNQPPVIEDLTYQTEAMKGTYSLSDLMYGPQTWKPAGETLPKAYPIYSGQDVTNTDESFYLCFVDLKTGNLGENSALSGLKNNGMAKIRFSLNGLPEGGMVVFNVYGYCAADQSNQGEGISWTNCVSGSGSSGILIRGSSGGGDGGISLGSDGGDSGESSAAEVWMPTIGNLNVSSSPVSAEIVLDAVPSGILTNATLMDLPVGTYSLTVLNRSYQEPEIQYITISAGRNTTIHFDLTPQVMPLTVLSSPAGADIIIDGTDTLWHTNTTLSDIPVGSHTITLHKDGYLPVSQNITLNIDIPAVVSVLFQENSMELLSLKTNDTPSVLTSPINIENNTHNQSQIQVLDKTITPEQILAPIVGVKNETESINDLFSWLFSYFFGHYESEEVQVPAQLSVSSQSAAVVIDNGSLSGNKGLVTVTAIKPEENIGEIQRTGSVYVTSYLENCYIAIDGKSTGYSTPHLIYGLKSGRHRVTVTTSDEVQASASEDIWIYPDEAVSVYLNPLKNFHLVSVDVKSKHLESDVFTVCGKGLTYTFPETVMIPSYGGYICTVSGGEYLSQLLPFLNEGDVVFVTDVVVPGTVQVESSPNGAEIIIDGFQTNYTTPAIIPTISEGYHIIQVVKDGFLPEQEEFRLINTKKSVDKTLYFVMEEYTCGRLFVNSTPAGANIYLHGVYTGETTPYLFEEIPIGTYDVGVVINSSMYETQEVTVISSSIEEMSVYETVLFSE